MPPPPRLLRLPRVLTAAIIILVGSGLTQADELLMLNGDRLSGEVISRSGDTLRFKTAYAGTIKIKWSEIKSVLTDDEMTLQLDNERVVQTRSITNDVDQLIVIDEADGESMVVPQETLTSLNPEPWELGEGYKFSGLVSFAAKVERGNNDKTEIDGDGTMELRRQRDRAKLFFEYEKDTKDGSATKNKWSIRNSYDYFPEKQWNLGMTVPKWFYGGTLVAQSDQFADLTLRLIAGPHIGYQFYEGHEKNLLLQTGIARVHEEFQNDPSNNFWGWAWHIDYDQYLLQDVVQFYHRQVGVYGVRGANKTLWTSWTGLRLPLWSGLIASTEMQVEYDSDPASDADTTDTTFRFKLGYRW